MKHIKSATIKGITLAMKNHQGIYYLLHNETVVQSSTEFNYISSLFDLWMKEL